MSFSESSPDGSVSKACCCCCEPEERRSLFLLPSLLLSRAAGPSLFFLLLVKKLMSLGGRGKGRPVYIFQLNEGVNRGEGGGKEWYENTVRRMLVSENTVIEEAWALSKIADAENNK